MSSKFINGDDKNGTPLGHLVDALLGRIQSVRRGHYPAQDQDSHAELKKAVRRFGDSAPLMRDRAVRRVTAQLNGYADAAHLTAMMAKRPSAFIAGSAKTSENSPAFMQAEELAYCLARAGFLIVHGGAMGNMEAAARGAQRACVDYGGVHDVVPSIGFAINMVHEEEVSPSLQNGRYVLIKDMSLRQRLCIDAEHIFVTRGGTGTLFEYFDKFTGNARLEHDGLVVCVDLPGDATSRRETERLLRGRAEEGLLAPGDEKITAFTDNAEEAASFAEGYSLLRGSAEWGVALNESGKPVSCLRIFQPSGEPLTTEEAERFKFYFAQLTEGVSFDVVREGDRPHVIAYADRRNGNVKTLMSWALTHTANTQGIPHSFDETRRMAPPVGRANILDLHIVGTARGHDLGRSDAQRSISDGFGSLGGK